MITNFKYLNAHADKIQSTARFSILTNGMSYPFIQRCQLILFKFTQKLLYQIKSDNKDKSRTTEVLMPYKGSAHTPTNGGHGGIQRIMNNLWGGFDFSTYETDFWNQNMLRREPFQARTDNYDKKYSKNKNPHPRNWLHSWLNKWALWVGSMSYM